MYSIIIQSKLSLYLSQAYIYALSNQSNLSAKKSHIENILQVMHILLWSIYYIGSSNLTYIAIILQFMFRLLL